MPHRKCGMENRSHVTNIHSPHMYKTKEAIKKTSKECFIFWGTMLHTLDHHIYLLNSGITWNYNTNSDSWPPQKWSTETPFWIKHLHSNLYWRVWNSKLHASKYLGGPGPNSTLHVSSSNKENVHGTYHGMLKAPFILRHRFGLKSSLLK